MQGLVHLTEDWVQKRAGSRHFSSPQTLQRFHQSVAISLNWSLVVKFCAQHQQSTLSSISPHTNLHRIDGVLRVLMFDDHFAFGDLFTFNPTRNNSNKNPPILLIWFRVWCILTGNHSLDLIVRGSTWNKALDKRSLSVIEYILLPVLSLKMFLNKTVSISRLPRAGWGESGTMFQWSGSLQTCGKQYLMEYCENYLKAE